MSFSSIAVNLPDPFAVFPQPNQFPLAKISHIPASQVISNAAGTTISAAYYKSPLVIVDGGTPTSISFALPAATVLYQVLGGLLDANGNVVADTKIQAGDSFVVAVHNTSAANTVDFTYNGGGNIPGAALAALTSGSLLVRWTTSTVGSAPVFVAATLA